MCDVDTSYLSHDQSIPYAHLREEIDGARRIPLQFPPQISDVRSNVVILVEFAGTPHIAK
jgi:hypothetical protein